MSTPTPTSYFDTPFSSRSTTLSSSPSISPSTFANSRPLCIYDISTITTQLLSKDAQLRSRCLVLYKSERRCEGSFDGASRSGLLAEAKHILQGSAPVSAEKCGKVVMRILFCKRHNEAGAYKRVLGCYYEQYESWKGDNSPAELEFLRAVRQVFQFSSTQFTEYVNTTPLPLATNIPLRPALPPTCNAATSGIGQDDSPWKDAKAEATCEAEVSSQFVVTGARPTTEGDHEVQESPPVKSATQKDPLLQSDEGHIVSEKISNQGAREKTVGPGNSSADIFSLSLRSSKELKSEANDEQNEPIGFPNIPVRREFERALHASRSTHYEVSPSLSPSPDSTLLTGRFFEPDGVESDAGPYRTQMSPTPGPMSGRRTSSGTPSNKPANANERIRVIIKKAATKEGYIYILKAPQFFARERPGQMPLVKIGMAMNPDRRVKEISKSCKMDDLERVSDTEDSSCRNYYKIEKLVHDELADYKQGLICAGKHRTKKDVETEHREWFAVSEIVALQTVQRWRRFMDQEPYDGRGILRDVWSKMTTRKDFQREEDQAFDEHERRHRYCT
ncbi:T5orf172 domain-containing protein [Rhexocercosporidium sp. MPI-PUGE-AT-0058]|nr:T5orf172 domain-containing protein [Rhexocercosporidium sp. MPI-PUGE-AT-0058]